MLHVPNGYRLLQAFPVAEGISGNVYQAEQENTGRKVALKQVWNPNPNVREQPNM
jgi:hypothetical protein